MAHTDPLTIAPLEMLKRNGISVFSDLTALIAARSIYRLTTTLLAVCVEGAVSAHIDLDVRRMSAGTIMVLRPGHRVADITKSEDFCGFFILLDEALYANMLPFYKGAMTSCFVYFRDNSLIGVDSAEMRNLRLLHKILERKLPRIELPYVRMMLHALCEALFYETVSIYISAMQRSGGNGQTTTRRSDLMNRFTELVGKHYASQRSVGWYAEQLHVSPKHLSSTIKEISGFTAGQWIDRKVVREAQILLRHTGKSIGEIADELNFANQSFFGKYFKNLTGKAPREYRTNTF